MNPNEAAKLLLEKNNILIVSHKHPDGDTIGSCTALCHALRTNGKTACLFRNTEITEKLMYYAEDYLAPEGFMPDFIVAVDVAGLEMQCKGADFEYDLVIDHHPSNPGFGRQNLIESNCSACGEIVLKVIEAMNGKADETEADLLYIALSTDTGCFQYANTNADSFEAAGRLIRYGAHNYNLNAKFFRQVSKARIAIEGMLYSTLRLYKDGKIALALITKQMIETAGATENDLDDIAGLAGRLDSQKVTITIRENLDGSSKVSIRSTQEIDSGAICSALGGGGHRMAAGCTINEDPEKAAEIVLKAIEEQWTDFS